MNKIRDKKLWWAVNFGTQHVKAPDYIPMPGLGLSIGMVLVMIMGACLFAGVVSAAADSPQVGLAIIGARALDMKQLRAMAARIPRNIERKESTSEQQLELEIKTIKTQIIDAIKAKADIETVNAMQRQLDAISIEMAQKHFAGTFGDQPDLGKLLRESDQIARLLHDKKGTAFIELPTALLERKTLIDRPTVGFSTVGVLQSDRSPGIVPEARARLFLRSLLTSRPTALGMVDFLKVNSAPAPASMQTESSAKTENAVTFTTASQKVETVATWIPASRQVLDDMTELMGYLATALPFECDLREETQLLFGNGTSPDLNGLYTQATAFDTSLLSLTPGWTKSDLLSCAVQQIQIAAETDPSFVVLHPTDYWQILRTKDANRNYMFGRNGMVDPFWGLTPVVTKNMSSGLFLVGSGAPVAAEIRDRMTTQLEISTQHSTYFTENKIAIRAEKRLALVCYRAASFIKGTFTTSP